MIKSLIEFNKLTSKVQDKTVVRVATSWWSDDRGFHQKKSVTYLKRKSTGVNLIHEDIRDMGINDVYECISNLNKIPDGIYELCTKYGVDEYGHVDESEYYFKPYKE